MPKACWEPIPLPAGMYCIHPGLLFVWEAMKEHPQRFNEKRGNQQSHLEVSENKHTHCGVHLFSHKQGDRQEDVACESHAYLGQYHWGIILYYSRESTCTPSFHQREQLTVSLNTRSELCRLTRNFVTKCSSPLEEVTCFAAQWYHFFFHGKQKEIQYSGGANQQTRGLE